MNTVNNNTTYKSTKGILDESEKLRVKRLRNKEAAARCRQRRMDLTNSLIIETERLEEEKKSLQKEIDLLERHKEELLFFLKSHNSNNFNCKLSSSNGTQILQEFEDFVNY